MCLGTTFPAWQAACLRHLLALDFVEPGLLILDVTGAARGPRERLKRLANLKTMLWVLYGFVSKFYSRSDRPVDMSRELADVPSIRCRVTRTGSFSQYFSDVDLARIREHRLDFIIRFGFNIIRGEILTTPRYGVWSFHHDDEAKYRGSPPGFWEIYKDDPATGAILQRLSDRLDGGIVLRKGFLPTLMTSYTRSRDAICLETAIWPAQVCIDIRNGLTSDLEGSPSTTQAPIYRAPTNGQMLAFAFKIARNRLARLLGSLFLEDSWNVGIVAAPIQSCLGSKTLSAKWLEPVLPNAFIADPFAVRDGEAIQVLVEEYDYYQGQGRITALRIAEGRTEASRVSMDVKGHASYPYLFEHEGAIYCIPETSRAGEIALFRAEAFPTRWTRVCTLVESFAGLDSTVFRHENRWWLLATELDKGSSEKLHAWHATELAGPWSPHEQNPVKIDVRSARCAGTPFRHEGELFRPAQDCSRSYGGRLTLNRVVRLTPHEFREEIVTQIEPDPRGPYPHALHTLCSAGDVTVIDGMRRVFIGRSLPLLAHRVGYLMGRIKSRLTRGTR